MDEKIVKPLFCNEVKSLKGNLTMRWLVDVVTGLFCLFVYRAENLEMTFSILVQSAGVRPGHCLIGDSPLFKKLYSEAAYKWEHPICLPGLAGCPVEDFTGKEHMSWFISNLIPA
jgi:hypothetical protein